MSKYPEFVYSKQEVQNSGGALRGDLLWSDDAAPAIQHIFAVANSWRDSHLFPMHHIRIQLAGQLRRMRLVGVTASRLKRMPSIRKKLRKIAVNLDKIQDLGGCRVILPTIEDVRLFSEEWCARGQHHLRKPDDYIVKPKSSGYRSLHLKLDYADEKYAAFLGRRIEVQVRTHLQHTWATAGEAVGLYRNEDLKAGQGDPEWLRLLYLMASEFAEAEDCPEIPDAPPSPERREEIREFDRKLNATEILDRLSHAFRFTDEYVMEKEYRFLLIQYDHAAEKVVVKGFVNAPEGARSYDTAESAQSIDAVLVSLDRLKNLKAAFPNYFGDVQLFREQLRHITKGRGAMEYDLPKQALAPPPPYAEPDLSWMRHGRFPRPDQGVRRKR
jgi:ppGpp synthetase/RelA/SpoT-type nucleotidyltranferase